MLTIFQLDWLAVNRREQSVSTAVDKVGAPYATVTEYSPGGVTRISDFSGNFSGIKTQFKSNAKGTKEE